MNMRFRYEYLLKLLVLVQMTSCVLFAETMHAWFQVANHEKSLPKVRIVIWENEEPQLLIGKVLSGNFFKSSF
jgi:hypothetical protein